MCGEQPVREGKPEDALKNREEVCEKTRAAAGARRAGWSRHRLVEKQMATLSLGMRVGVFEGGFIPRFIPEGEGMAGIFAGGKETIRALKGSDRFAFGNGDELDNEAEIGEVLNEAIHRRSIAVIRTPDGYSVPLLLAHQHGRKVVVTVWVTTSDPSSLYEHTASLTFNGVITEFRQISRKSERIKFHMTKEHVSVVYTKDPNAVLQAFQSEIHQVLGAVGAVAARVQGI